MVGPSHGRQATSDDRSPVPLVDSLGRRLDYLRLSVTDRCNLHCRYCTPPRGSERTDRSTLLTWEEMEGLCEMFVASLGVNRIRITGGEPLIRRGLPDFLDRLRGRLPGTELLLTTNGTLLAENLDALARAGIHRLNLSIDSLRPAIYRAITGRDGLDRVLSALDLATGAGFAIKINVVVLAGVNDDEIPDFVEMTRDRPWSVRFIEPMPFHDARRAPSSWAQIDGDRVREIMERSYDLRSEPCPPSATAAAYRVPGFAGTVGIIYARSRRFCSGCSRLRVSAQGQLRTCLYGAPVLDLKTMIREGMTTAEMDAAVRRVVATRAPNGQEAETARSRAPLGSMASIGG
jgi:GTP 3',8-cyclase